MDELLSISGAMYDRTRLAILAFLGRHGPCCVCELEASLALLQSRLSRHLKILKEAGFLSDRREGKWVYYELDDAMSPLHRSLIDEILARIPPSPPKVDACAVKGD